MDEMLHPPTTPDEPAGHRPAATNDGADGPVRPDVPAAGAVDDATYSGDPQPNRRRRHGSRGGRGRVRVAGEAVDGADSDERDPPDDRPEGTNGAQARTPVGRAGAVPDVAPDADDTKRGVTPRPPRGPRPPAATDDTTSEVPVETATSTSVGSTGAADKSADVELPERAAEGRPRDVQAATAALVPHRPRIGDTRPAPPVQVASAPPGDAPRAVRQTAKGPKGPKIGGDKPRGAGGRGQGGDQAALAPAGTPGGVSADRKKRREPARGKGRGRPEATVDSGEAIERKRGRERNGRPVGRYLMCVQARDGLTQVAVLEGLSLIEHYVSRPADDVAQIHGNIYLGRVQNVLPGMEAAFVDIATPKNAVLYRGDVQYDSEDIVERSEKPKIEQMIKARQLIVAQVTKNPIGAKGARLTQEVSLPGRFVVLIPNSRTYGISKRLPDDERRRLRGILDRVKPAEHGLIVRTAAEGASEEELRADVLRLAETWADIARRAELARKKNQPSLLYREPSLEVRVIREEFNAEYRGIVIDDQRLYEDVKSYIQVMNPELADRVEFYDAAAEGLSLFEKQHVHEQLHKALDRKVWLPSGGSLIIEHTEALTVIDVNTGKNVGTSNLESTVFHNNLEAAEEIARQLRLRDIGGIIVIDFIDMEIRENRRKVVDAFRAALGRDKTRTQVFDISELGLVEMTRKRIGEGMLTAFADECTVCQGRGLVIDHALLD